MKEFEKILTEVMVTEEERDKFISICSDWGLYCSRISSYDMGTIIKLMAYLVAERRGNTSLLQRAVGKFNKLNKLTSKGVLSCSKNK